jgi:hypothetical protein
MTKSPIDTSSRDVGHLSAMRSIVSAVIDNMAQS